MSWEILTPFTRTASVELSGTARPRWRKQIMKLQKITYRDKLGERVVDFNQPYLESLAAAYRSKAFDQVPFQLADGANSHNNDPERFRGALVGVELTKDGLDGIFEPTPDGEALIKKNPDLGVSCRIIENLAHADGRTYPRAIQHVLGTVNPQLTGMRPWEKVDLSAVQTEQTWDLSTEQMQEDTVPDTDTVTLELSKERADRLTALLDDMDAADKLADIIELTDPDGDEQESGDESAEEPDDAPQIDLSKSDQFVALQSSYESQNARILELTQQIRAKDLNHELAELAKQGLAPAIIKAAQPLLSVPSGSIELAGPDGSRTDPGEVVRDVLRTVLELSLSGLAVVGLDAETGYLAATVDSAQTRRDALLKDWDDTYGH